MTRSAGMLAFILLFLTVVPDTSAGRAGNVEPSADYVADLDSILAAVVTADGLVRYDLLRGPLNRRFRRVLKHIEEFDPARLSSQKEHLAFWMNAYNVQILQSVLEAPPIRDIVADGHADRLFNRRLRTARTSMTLDELEQVILRRADGPARLESLQADRLDPRIHVGLNCGAISCPPLRARAFRAETIDSVLHAAMRDFVNSPQHFRRDGRNWTFSSILDWYGEDFDAAEPAGDFLRRYVDDARPDADALRRVLSGRRSNELKQLPFIRFEYDWTLNSARRP